MRVLGIDTASQPARFNKAECLVGFFAGEPGRSWLALTGSHLVRAA